MKDEIEVVRHPHIGHLNLFVVDIDYRSSHFHSDFELNLVLSGSARLLTGSVSLPLNEGELALINPNEAHEIRTNGGGVTILCMQLSPHFLRDTLPSAGHLSFDEVLLSRSSEVKPVFIELAWQYFARHEYWQILCSGLLDMLMYTLLNEVPLHFLTEDERRANKKRSERLGRIVSYVEENCTYKLLLSDLARQEGVTMGYLSHFISENLRLSFQEYLSSVRLFRAKPLLLSGGRLSDISVECGFSDPRYLTKAFLRFEGCTPEEYCKRHAYAKERLESGSSQSLESFFSPDDAKELLSGLRLPLGSVLDKIFAKGN